MIATAIGKLIANAPPIPKVKAESRFAAGRIRFSTDMLLTPPIGKSKSRHRRQMTSSCAAHHYCGRPPSDSSNC